MSVIWTFNVSSSHSVHAQFALSRTEDTQNLSWPASLNLSNISFTAADLPRKHELLQRGYERFEPFHTRTLHSDTTQNVA